MVNSFLVSPHDSVAIVTKPIAKGEEVTYDLAGEEAAMTAIDDIPIYHKIATKHIEKGDTVLKYGEVIGYATAHIEMGAHVHTHNLSDIVERKE